MVNEEKNIMIRKYITDYYEGTTCVLRAILRQEQQRPTQKISKLEKDPANSEFANQIHNFIDSEDDFAIIASETFPKIIEDLKKEKLIKASELISVISNNFGVEGDEQDKLHAVWRVSQIYPNVPSYEFTDDLFYKYVVLSVDGLKKKLINIKERQEIINIQGARKKKKVAYEIFFENNEIYINRQRLSKTRSYSNNDEIFSYIFTHPCSKITKRDISESLRVERKKIKNFTSVLDDLKFKGEIRRLFFSKSSKDTIFFRNPIYVDDLKSKELEKFKDIDIISLVKKYSKRRK